MACLGAPVALQSPLCASRGANSHAVHMWGEVTSDQQPCEKTLGCPEFSSSEPAHTIVVNVREDGEALCTGRGIYAAHACSKSLDRDTLLTQRTQLRPWSDGCPLVAFALPVGLYSLCRKGTPVQVILSTRLQHKCNCPCEAPLHLHRRSAT